MLSTFHTLFIEIVLRKLYNNGKKIFFLHIIFFSFDFVTTHLDYTVVAFSMPNEPEHSTNPPAWASILLERVEQLESRLSSTTFISDDPNVVIRAPGSEFTPSVAMVQQHPYIAEDFFRRPLDDNQRRRYLFECPKNTLRQYEPPKLNSVQLNQQAKLVDTQIYQIQYRLSGLTRPLDWFTYQLLQNKWDPATLQLQSKDLVVGLHELLSDIASYITTLRTQNVYRGIPGRVEAPPDSTDNLLLDPSEMVEHIKLQRTIQQATTQQPSSNRKRNNRHRSNRSARGDASANPPGDSSASNGNTNSGSQSTAPSSSRGFQQRHTTKRNQ